VEFLFPGILRETKKPANWAERATPWTSGSAPPAKRDVAIGKGGVKAEQRSGN